MRFSIAILVLALSIFGAFDDLDSEAHASGRGGVISFTRGADAIFGNPAGLGLGYRGDGKNIIATTHYTNFWGVEGDLGAGAGYRSALGNFAVGFRNFGNADYYAEQLISLSYSTSIRENLSLGARFNYGIIDQGDYGSWNVPMFDLGLNWELSDMWNAAFIWQNISGAVVEVDEEEVEIYSPMSLALSIDPNEWLEIGVDLQKYEGGNFRLRAYQRMLLGETFAFNMGVSGRPNKFHLGVEASKWDITLAYSAVVHAELGLTNHIAIRYE